MLSTKSKASVPRLPHFNAQTGDSRLVRRGHGNLNAELFQKLYFSTSSKQALPDHKADDIKQAVVPSMKVLHVGGGYMKSEAPVPMRSHCTYSHEYHKMPLDDAPVTRALRTLIASTSRAGSSTNQVVEGLSLSSDTTNKAYYGCYGDKPVHAEVATIVRPEGYIRINHDARFMESKTVFQRDYPLYSETLQNKGRQPPQKSADERYIIKGKFDDMTSYKRGIGKDSPARYPGVGKSQSMGDLLQAAKNRQAAAFSGRNHG